MHRQTRRDRAPSAARPPSSTAAETSRKHGTRSDWLIDRTRRRLHACLPSVAPDTIMSAAGRTAQWSFVTRAAFGPVATWLRLPRHGLVRAGFGAHRADPMVRRPPGCPPARGRHRHDAEAFGRNTSPVSASQLAAAACTGRLHPSNVGAVKSQKGNDRGHEGSGAQGSACDRNGRESSNRWPARTDGSCTLRQRVRRITPPSIPPSGFQGPSDMTSVVARRVLDAD